MTCHSCDADTEADLMLCQPCINTATRIVSRTPGILAAMHTTIAKLARVKDEGRTGKTLHAPAPANIDALEKKHALRAALVNAALAVGHASADRPPNSTDPEVLALWLMPKTDWFAWDETTADACADLIDAHRKATAAIDRPVERIDIGECGFADCTERLYPAKGQRIITCPGCGCMWDVAERRDAAFTAARSVLRPAAEIARALTHVGYPTTPNAVYLWVHKGRLEAVLCDVAAKQPLYRFSDAWAVAKEIRDRRTKAKA